MDLAWHALSGGAASARMTPVSAQFEDYGIRFSAPSQACQELVG